MLLASTWAAAGVGSLALQGKMDLPGMNVEGTHLPWVVTAVSALLVGWAGWTLYQEALHGGSPRRDDLSGPPPPVVPLQPPGRPRS